MDKEQLRIHLKNKRLSMSESEVNNKSEKIFLKIINLPQYKKAKNIMCYLSFKNEVNTDRLIKHALSRGKNVAVPVTDFKNHEMRAALIKNIEKDTQKNRFGIREPIKPAYIEGSDIDLIIVPGIGFDKSCNRLGMGGGFYDRFLPHTNSFNVGVCFEDQITDEVYSEKHDIPVDMVITEEGDKYYEKAKA